MIYYSIYVPISQTRNIKNDVQENSEEIHTKYNSNNNDINNRW